MTTRGKTEFDQPKPIMVGPFKLWEIGAILFCIGIVAMLIAFVAGGPFVAQANSVTSQPTPDKTYAMQGKSCGALVAVSADQKTIFIATPMGWWRTSVWDLQSWEAINPPTDLYWDTMITVNPFTVRANPPSVEMAGKTTLLLQPAGAICPG